jgi:hypothetical protein
LLRVTRFFFAFTLFTSQFGFIAGQDSVRDEIFKDTTDSFRKADELNTRILSPKNYADARKLLIRAQDLFNKGDRLDKIQTELHKCKTSLTKAMEVAELGQVALKDVLSIRSEVVNSGLRFNQARDFTEAEKKLKQAAERVEKDDLKGARKPSSQAIQSYRKAVLQVLQKDFLSDAWKKLKDGKKTINKELYRKSEDTLKDLERLVKSNKGSEFSIPELTNMVISKVDEVMKAAGIPD